MKWFKSKKKGTQKEQLTPEQVTAQGWLPFHDIYNNLLYRKDNSIVVAIRVEPINMNLLSESEQKTKIHSYYEVLNGIDYPTQTISISRPVDLDGYIARLEEKKRNEPDFKKRRLIDGDILTASKMATSGQTMERKFYILISMLLEKKADDVLFRRAIELAGNLTSAGLVASVCDDQELRDINFIFTHPAQAAYERAPQSNLSFQPIFEGSLY